MAPVPDGLENVGFPAGAGGISQTMLIVSPFLLMQRNRPKVVHQKRSCMVLAGVDHPVVSGEG